MYGQSRVSKPGQTSNVCTSTPRVLCFGHVGQRTWGTESYTSESCKAEKHWIRANWASNGGLLLWTHFLYLSLINLKDCCGNKIGPGT